VGRLREIGILPDILICRTEKPITTDIRKKIGLFCNVPVRAVIEEKNVDFSIYEVPIVLHREGLDGLILKHFGLPYSEPDLTEWESMLEGLRHPDHETEIAVVGKYIELTDAYKSIFEALTHAGIANGSRVKVRKVASQAIERDGVERQLSGVSGVLVPGGFGDRGIQGKVDAIRYARENKIPFLGICLGMQCASVELARNLLGLEGAHSAEFEPKTAHPVISLLEEQLGVEDLGGTMRLGAYACRLLPGSRAHDAYGRECIHERHRHRYEFNNQYREAFAKAGVRFSGLSPDGSLVEILELVDHPWFVGCQFHPEFKSKPIQAHPLFRGFVRASLERNGVQVEEELSDVPK
jgi:CTP synthase